MLCLLLFLSFSVFSSFFLFFYHFNKLSGTPYTKWFIRTIPPRRAFYQITNYSWCTTWMKAHHTGFDKEGSGGSERTHTCYFKPVNSQLTFGWHARGGKRGRGCVWASAQSAASKAVGELTHGATYFFQLYLHQVPHECENYAFLIYFKKQKKKKKNAHSQTSLTVQGPRNEIKTKEGDRFSYLS